MGGWTHLPAGMTPEAMAAYKAGFMIHGDTCVMEALEVQPSPEITEDRLRNIVEFDSYIYATNDFVEPDHLGELAQAPDSTKWKTLPIDWELVPDDMHVVRNVIAAHPWGSAVIITSHGEAYTTNQWS